jgi:adenylate cyclase
MDRIWQWAWDRNGPRYLWALWTVSLPVLLPAYLFSSLAIVAFEIP